MEENAFYIARYKSGKIDTKINLTKRDLTLAFISGRFQGYKEGDIKIYKVNLDAVVMEEISVSEILKQIEENKIKRKECEEKERKREIKLRIEALERQL